MLAQIYLAFSGSQVRLQILEPHPTYTNLETNIWQLWLPQTCYNGVNGFIEIVRAFEFPCLRSRVFGLILSFLVYSGTKLVT